MDRMDANMFIFIIVMERIEEVYVLVFEVPHAPTFFTRRGRLPIFLNLSVAHLVILFEV